MTYKQIITGNKILNVHSFFKRDGVLNEVMTDSGFAVQSTDTDAKLAISTYKGSPIPKAPIPDYKV